MDDDDVDDDDDVRQLCQQQHCRALHYLLPGWIYLNIICFQFVSIRTSLWGIETYSFVSSSDHFIKTPKRKNLVKCLPMIKRFTVY